MKCYMIQRSFSGLCGRFILHCCSLHAAVGTLLPRGPGHVSLPAWPLQPCHIASYNLLFWFIFRVVQMLFARSCYFSFCMCLRQACKCFWSRKSQLWMQSSCHKLKTGRGREKGRRINEKHIRETLLLLEMTDTLLFCFVFWCSFSMLKFLLCE